MPTLVSLVLFLSAELFNESIVLGLHSAKDDCQLICRSIIYLILVFSFDTSGIAGTGTGTGGAPRWGARRNYQDLMEAQTQANILLEEHLYALPHITERQVWKKCKCCLCMCRYLCFCCSCLHYLIRSYCMGL